MGRTSHAAARAEAGPQGDLPPSPLASARPAEAPEASGGGSALSGIAQLALYGRPAPVRARVGRAVHQVPLCAWCRAKEARYGFRDEQDPVAARPRTLCFDCFRVEIGRRQAVAAQLRARAGRGWNARQVELPLQQTLDALTRRRRRAQIAARHALGI